MCKTKDSKHMNWIEKVIWMSPRKNTGNIGEICIKRWSWMVIINVLHKWLYISLSLSSWSQALPRSYAKEWKKELWADVTNHLFSLWNQQHRKKSFTSPTPQACIPNDATVLKSIGMRILYFSFEVPFIQRRP